jgi:tetratricopeptide (TPR) repeat protein
MKTAWKSLGTVCVLVIGMYAYTAPLGKLESLTSNPADTYYNLLVQGFRDGHLSVKKEVPTAFARLADPYDPAANRFYRGMPYGMSDLSYYMGRLYLYFGVTPALIVFWPFVALTGHYLVNRLAVTIFCAVGVTVSLGLLCAVWRRYFSEVSVWVVAACALALGLATGVPVLLPPSDIYQVAISCGYMLTLLALGAVWCALHDRERTCRWLMAASVAYGLAVGARPSLLFGGIILLVPVIRAWRERRPIGAVLMAATIPITLIGLGLMLYNALRFDNPFEFGQRYELAGFRQVTGQFFNLRYFGFNFLVNFLEPARWSGRFPFVHEIAVPPLPSGYLGVQDPFGVLTNIPLVWLALAVPLAWRERSGQERGALRLFAAAMALLFGMCALTLGFYNSSAGRYEVDFLPALVLLAVVGILGLERVLATPGAWLAGPPVRRRLVRWGWSVLLGFSVVFNVLVSVKNYAYAGCSVGTMLVANGRVTEAIRVFENALRIEPDYAEGHHNLGKALWRAGKRPEAIREYEYVLRLKPDLAEEYYLLGIALWQTGKGPEAIRKYEDALRLKPDYAEAHSNLGGALAQTGKIEDAIAHYEQALRIKPDLAEAHYNLALALAQLGRAQEAIGHLELALRIKPDFAEVHYSLANGLAQTGKIEEAIAHYEQALRIKPDLAEAHGNLGFALARLGRVPEAVGHWEQALRLKPDYAEAHGNLGLALAQLGRVPEAVGHWEQALRIKPDYAEVHYVLGMALEQAGKIEEAIAHYEQALRIKPDLAEARNALARLRVRQ